MTAGIETKNGSYEPHHTPFGMWFVIQKLGLNIVYLCAQFDDSSFNHSRDIIGG